MEKISGVYKITNSVTGDFYIGSSRDIKRRWNQHRKSSLWVKHPNIMLYQCMNKYGLDNFVIEIIEETDDLKEREQYWIDMLKPIYNNRQAIGYNIERYRETYRRASRKYVKVHREEHLAKSKEWYREHQAERREYFNRLCVYNGETLKLATLAGRFIKQGISHPVLEAKKYLIKITN